MEKVKQGYENPTMEELVISDNDVVTLSVTDNDKKYDMGDW